MDISEFLQTIAATYDRKAGISTPAQRLLRAAGSELAEHVPVGFKVLGRGGQTSPTFTPWIGILDPDETSTPHEGLYIAYLFSSDLDTVALSLQQGITTLQEQLGRLAAREKLATDASAIRKELGPSKTLGFDSTLRLGQGGFRQLGYVAGNVGAIHYSTELLPDETILRQDLSRFFGFYQDAIASKRHLLQVSPGTLSTGSVLQQVGGENVLDYFKPKSDAEYTATLRGRTLSKSRRHEQLINEYARWVANRGFGRASPHPIDLEVSQSNERWIVEGKVLYQGSATEAVRSALGQLFAYRHFHYKGESVRLLALFTEPIGQAYVRFLESCGVASVWSEGGKWTGSPLAYAHKLCEVAMH